MKTALLILFLICFTNKGFSQSSATVTLKTGETISGSVDYPVYANEKKLKIKADKKQSVNREDIKEVTWGSETAGTTFIPIKGYKNAKNKKVQDGILAEKVLELENISLYKAFTINTMQSGPGGAYKFTSVDVFWYCKRPGEDVATVVSWTFNSQVNKNNVFRNNAAQYFKDHPELAQKIESKQYKHEDLTQIVQEYNTWKVSE